MIITKQGTTSVVTREATTFPEFMQRLQREYTKLQHENMVVDLFSLESVTHVEVADFLSLSQKHQEGNKSFVIVSRSVDIDKVPEALQVVPTLQEAHDIIEMEEIERDLFSE